MWQGSASGRRSAANSRIHEPSVNDSVTMAAVALDSVSEAARNAKPMMTNAYSACPSNRVAPKAATTAQAASSAFTCTEVIGVSVTGDWFNAGFEEGLDNGRWQVRWKSHAFIEGWAVRT